LSLAVERCQPGFAGENRVRKLADTSFQRRIAFIPFDGFKREGGRAPRFLAALAQASTFARYVDAGLVDNIYDLLEPDLVGCAVPLRGPYPEAERHGRP